MPPQNQQEVEAPGTSRSSFDDGTREDDESFDIIKYWFLLLENKWLIAISVILCFGLGRAYLFTTVPIYKVDALVQIEDDKKPLSGLEEVTSLSEESDSSISAEMEIMRSRMVLGRVVENLALDVIGSPQYFRYFGKAMADRWNGPEGQLADPPFDYFDAPEYAWGGERIRIQTLRVPPHLLSVPMTLIAGEGGRYELFDAAGGALLTGKVGERAEKFLDESEPLQLFVSQLIARPGTRFTVQHLTPLSAIQRLQGSLLVQEKGKQSQMVQLFFTDPDPADAARILTEILHVELRQNVERRSEEAARRLEFVGKQLPAVKGQLDIAERAFNDYRQRQRSVDLDFETKKVLDKIVEREAEIRLLELKKGEMRQRFTPVHPMMVALDSQIARARGELETIDKRVLTLPGEQQEVLRFTRDIQVNTQLYTQLLNSSQELRVAKAGTIGTVRTIDPPMLPASLASPNYARIKMLSILGGFALGIGLAFLLRALRSGIEDPDAIEEGLSLPVYATVPFSKAQRGLDRQLLQKKQSQDTEGLEAVPVAAYNTKESVVVESLRSLRTTLHFAMLDVHKNTILITGPRPQVGKSFIAVNLSVILAHSGKRILLIDGDMRKGHLNRYFGIPRDRGLSELTSGELELHTTIHTTRVPNLDFMPTGILPPNPSELLMHDRFGALLEAAGSRYDLVILDSPPVLAATDAVLIGQQVGATLMVVKYGLHPMRELRDAVKRLKQGGVNLRGAIMNQVPVSSRGYGYGYGYGRYAYRYYAYDDKQSRK